MTIEELALLLFDMVAKRFATNDIVSQLLNNSTNTIGPLETEEVERLVNTYRRDKSNLESISKEIHKIILVVPTTPDLVLFKWPKFGD